MPPTSTAPEPPRNEGVRQNTEALVELTTAVVRLTAAVVRMAGLQGNGLAKAMLAKAGVPTVQPTDKHTAEVAKRYWAERERDDKAQQRAEQSAAKREEAARNKPVGDVRSILGLLAKRAAGAVAPGVTSFMTEPARAGDSTGRLVGKAAAQLPGAALGLMGKAALGVIPIFAKVAGALAPLALLGVALGSGTSGFGVFMTAIKLLGSVLGALLLPIFVVLSAAVYSVATYLMDALLPVLGDYYALVIGAATQAVDVLSAAFETAKTVILIFAEVVGSTIQTMFALGEAVVTAIVDFAKKYGLAIAHLSGMGGVAGLGTAGANAFRGSAAGDLGASIATLFKEKMKEADMDRKLGARGGKGDQTLGGRFQEGLTATIQELRRSMGPQAQTFGIAQASRQAQLAALNISPFESKMLKFSFDVLQKMDEAIAKQRPAVTN